MIRTLTASKIPSSWGSPIRTKYRIHKTLRGQWITQPPTHCPNGHPLGPNQVLVGHVACLGHGGGHTTWTCGTCDQTVYGPPMNTHCTTLEGPATVRISTKRS